MALYSKKLAIQRLNDLGKRRIPTLFIINYAGDLAYISPLDQLTKEVAIHFPNYQFNSERSLQKPMEKLEITPPTFEEYRQQFNTLQLALQSGEISLANLTFPTIIKNRLPLEAIFQHTTARYRLLLMHEKMRFVSFSPETFIKVKGDSLFTYPMKGTIDATLPDAEKRLLTDPKELEEHQFAVEEAKRDLSLVSKSVTVKRFRYLERVERGAGAILQSSSEVCGRLPSNYHHYLGELLFKLIPAGSITGSPKAATIARLKEIETYDRQFYSGVAGIFDGKEIDSTVLIRFIEEEKGVLTFKSGGGITAQSDCRSEYDELLQKIYLPIS